MFIIKLLVLFCMQLMIVKSDEPCNSCVNISDNQLNNSTAFPLIFYGTKARIEDFPFYAATESCGATILTAKWLLTAAHCVKSPNLIANRFVFVGGDEIRNSIRNRYDYIVMHPKYRVTGDILYDIALLRLEFPLFFTSKIQPVKLPQWNSMNSELQVVGRGQNEHGIPSISLMKIKVKTLSPVECVYLTSLGSYHGFLLDQSIICARTVDGRPGICGGDSGGPLVQNNTIVGLVSFIHDKDCSKVNIGYYTNVASYVPWIKSIINS